ncbi:MAG TPA: FMN-binding protein [Fulvivirga sp.]|nr:FMN-binding protein [Fulvivirga sp.]
MKNLIVLFIISLTSLAFQNNSQLDLPNNAQKKVHKAFDKLWDGAAVDYQQITITDEVQNDLDADLKRLHLYRLSVDGQLKGYMFLSAAPSKYDYFDFMVIYNPDLSIALSEVLIYREGYGGEIGSSRWLKQFIGMTSDNEMRLDYDVQGISGATISVRSATNAIKRLTNSITQLRSHGKL